MGTEIARTLHAKAIAAPEKRPEQQPEEQQPGPARPDPERLASAFDRIARCVRRCILLAQAVAQPPATPAAQAPQPRRAPAAGSVLSRAQSRRRIIRAVENHIQLTRPEQTDTLRAELLDRLDMPETEEDLANRPLSDVIGEILRDLGLHDLPGMPHERRTPADIRTLNALAARPTPRTATPFVPPPAPSPAKPPAPGRPPPPQSDLAALARHLPSMG